MFSISIQTVASIIIMMGAGAILRHVGVLTDDSGKILRGIIANVATPSLTIYNLLGNFPREQLKTAGTMALVPALVMLVFYAAAALLARWMRLKRGRRGAFANMCALSNSIYMGLPVCQSLFGDVATPYAMIFYFVNVGLFWTMGVSGLYADPTDGGTQKITPKFMLKKLINMPQITFLLSIALLLLDVYLPPFLLDTARQLGAMTSPLALIFIGLVLYSTGFKGMKPDKSLWIMMLFRFIIVPFATLYFCVMAGIPEFPTLVISILAGMPAMVLTVIMSDAAGADTRYAAAGISISTVFSLVLIPVYMETMPWLISLLSGT